jgi:glycosyltransferase involved in cell wall biosynthesis
VSSISVIIPVRNDGRRLANCLQSIRSGEPADVEVIVVDNGSIDDSVQVAKSARARVLELPGRRVSELRNEAAAMASAPILAFVDADHELGDGWVEAALQIMADADIAAAGALYEAPVSGTWVQHLYGALRGRTSGHSPARWLGSGNMVVRAQVFRDVGGFDTRLVACEDVDFCQRLRVNGGKIVADDRLRSVHLGDPPTLRDLFRAERWRGRDNLRVSLRGPLSLRDVPSVVAPFVMLLALAVVVGAVISTAAGGPAPWLLWVIPAGAVFILLARTARIVGNLPNKGPETVARALAVSSVYEIARAAALVTRAPHHRR